MAVTMHRDQMTARYLTLRKAVITEINKTLMTQHTHSHIHPHSLEECRSQESDATFCASESAPAENRPEPTTRNRPDPSLNSVRLRLPGSRIDCLGDLLIREGRRCGRSRVAATRTPPAAKAGYGAMRQGAKAVERIGRESVAYKLSPEDATTFRALSARGIHLSQDRADICFSTKELCREFAIPNQNSQQNLKRVCRYLAGKPRLVHQYD